MANIFRVDRTNNKIELGTIDTTINVDSHTASQSLALDASKNLVSVDLSAAYQPLDNELSSLAALSYVAASFVKMTEANTFALRTIANVRTDLSITNVEDTAISGWAGSGNITTVGALASGSIAVGFTEIAVDYTAAKCTVANADNTAANQTSHADVVVDGDFGSNGILNRTGLGAYSILAIGSDVQAHGDVLDHLNVLGQVGADSEFLVGTAAGALAWENAATAKTSIGLGNVENTQLSTWAGTTNITTLGTIATVGNITIAENGTIGQAAGPLVTFNDAGNDLKISNCNVSIAGPGTSAFVPATILHLKEAAPQLTFEGTGGANLPKFIAKTGRQTPNNFFLVEYWGKNSAASQELYGSMAMGGAEAAGNKEGYIHFNFANGAGEYTTVCKIFGSGKIGVNDINPNSNFDVTGDINTTMNYKVDDTKVIGNQGAAVANATDAASTMARLNDLLARCRAHGLIAT